jgi:glycosyltransferase involved in cell wall biosynthesis
MRKICVLTPTRITINAFLKPHLLSLARHFDVTLAYNPHNDSFLPPVDVAVRQVDVGIQRKIALGADIKTLIELFFFFRREKFDMVISLVPKAALLGMVAAWLAGVPRRVPIFQGEVWASRHGLMRMILKNADRITAHAATHILAVGTGERDFLEAEHIIRKGSITVLGQGSISGVDCNRFKPDTEKRAAMRSQLGLPDTAVVCLFVGRLNADKGVFELAQAFREVAARNKNLYLLMVGPDEENIGAALRASLPVDIAPCFILHPFTPTPEYYLAAADFLCLPSYREGFAVSLLEAAAAGVPTIGTRIYGIADAIVEGETGLLISPKNVPELAAAMQKLAGDANLRASFATASRARVLAHYQQNDVVAVYTNYFCSLF